MTDSTQPTVTIVGAGMAGLTAALALAERGYQVTIYEKGPEQDAGGNLGAIFHKFDEGEPVCFEVFPHMFGDWYLNFFDLAEKLGLHKHRDFRRCPKLGYATSGPNGEVATVVDNGSPQTFLQNIRSGAGAPHDLFLVGYAVLDILTQSFMEGGLESEQSLNGFLVSRQYATPGMLRVFQSEMLYVWAINSYVTSVQAYQKFSQYQIGSPAPSSWSLNGNAYERIVQPLLELLKNPPQGSKRTPIEIEFNAMVCGITAKPGHVHEICIESERHADPAQLEHEHRHHHRKRRTESVNHLILAVPPSALGPLMTTSAKEACCPEGILAESNAISSHVPNVAYTRLLDSGPLAVLYVPLTRTFDFIRPYYIGLVDSPAMLTFIEVSHLSAALGPEIATVIAIGISNVSLIEAWQGNGPVDGPATPAEYTVMGDDSLNWRIARQVLQEFTRYVPRDQQRPFHESVVARRLYLKANNTKKIFLNMVGNRLNAPPTLYPQLPNLCFATGTNDSPIEIATVECAVVGGLLAARALWQQNPASQGNTHHPINPRMPPRYDWAPLLALRVALAPWALAAKCLANGQETFLTAQAIGPGPMRSLLVIPLELAEAIWLVSLIPGLTASQYLAEIFPPQPQSLQGLDIKVIGDASDLVNSTIEAATIPAWLGIQSARLGADIVAEMMLRFWRR